MITLDFLRELALSFPETTEEPHFEKISFRVKKKIFATYDTHAGLACVKLSDTDQDVFSAWNRCVIYPVDNKWGKQGWTLVELEKIPQEMFVDILTTAYCEVAPAKLAAQIRTTEP